MPQVPTGKMESKLRSYYLQWVAGIPRHADDLESYLDEFRDGSRRIIAGYGGRTVSAGYSLNFPPPKELKLSPVFNKVYDDMRLTAVRASIASGLNAKDAARAMLNAGMDKEYYKLERVARTETVSAYWANQWEQIAGLEDQMYMVWGSERSSRTCDYCRSKNGMEVRDPTIRDHPNGRCTLIPKLRPDREKFRMPEESAAPGVYRDIHKRSSQDGFVKWWLDEFGGKGAYIWNEAFRRGNVEEKWLPDKQLKRVNEVYRCRVNNTVGSLAQHLVAHGAVRSRKRFGVWRGESSQGLWETAPGGSVKTLYSTTSTSVDLGEASCRLGDGGGVLYALDVLPGNLLLPGRYNEGELILVPGSRIQVVQDTLVGVSRLAIKGVPDGTRLIQGYVLPPVVGEPYYGGGTYRVG